MASRSFASDFRGAGRRCAPGGSGFGQKAVSRRESLAERRERRAAVHDPAVVLDAAARLLEVRPRSTAEVRRRLVSAGYRPGLVDVTIDRLVELGYLDDAAFARAWVESRDRARPRGEIALRRELRLKGVERDAIEASLAARRGESLEVDDLETQAPSDALAPAAADERAAERLLTRHARALGRVADPRLRRQRAYALLARNGFDPETCRLFAARVTDTAPSEAGLVADADPEPGPEPDA